MKKRVSLLVTLLAIVIMGFAMSVEAAEIIDQGYCGSEGEGTNLTWTLDSDYVLVIEGQGAMKNWTHEQSYIHDPNFQPIDWQMYSTKIRSVIIREGVTSIGDYAFGCFYSLDSIILPESLTSMGNRCFYCSNKFGNIDLPETLTSMGEGVFMECSSLKEIDLPDSWTRIESRTFYGCSKLNNIKLPKSLTTIGDAAFYWCSSLTNIDLPESLTKIESWAFNGCRKLSSIDLPESLMSIGHGAFEYCKSLNKIELPKSITEINAYLFEFSEKFDSIYIPSSVNRIYQNAFWETDLKDIYYGGSEEQWKNIVIYASDNKKGYRDPFPYATIHYNSLGIPELPSPEPPSPDRYLVDAASYNKDLAFVAANLSLKAYNDVVSDESVKNYLINDLGFGEEDIFTSIYSGTLAYTLATRKYYGTDAGDNTDILVIAAQGSPNPYEMIPEAVSKPDYDKKKAFGGHVPYDIVEEYYNAIVKDLSKVVKSGKNYKVLITGHGLAGAAANLVAANLSDGRIEEVKTERADVFCYTFGALKPLDENAVIKGNYENIHNVYNLYDTFSSLQYGVGEGFGMFGQVHLFVRDNRTPKQRNQGNDESIFRYVYRQIYHHVNHDMEKYYSYVESVKDGQNDLNNLITEESAKHVSIIIGPVDVDVYCDNELVGRVTKNAVDATANSIDIRIEGDTKTILYPDDSRYEIRISALDEGRMTFGQIDLIGRGVTKVIKDVSLTEKGKLFSGTVGGGRTASEFKLYETNTAMKVLYEAKVVSKNVDLISFYKLMSFTSRLYRNFLKREPDETGLGDWVDALYSGRGTGAKVVSGFVLSKEYEANSLSDEEYVTALYRIIFNREPDKDGLESWVSVLKDVYTNKKVLEGFINSVEFSNLCKDLGIEPGDYKSPDPIDNNYDIAKFVERLYNKCLERAYEREGLENWVKALVNRTATGSSVVKSFFNSQEFLNRNLNNESFVKVAYKTILNRDADPSGLEGWMDALERGYTRNQVLAGFLESTEFGDLCNKYGIRR